MGDNDPYLIIAADSHAGLPTEQYRAYLEKKFHPQFDEFLARARRRGRGRDQARRAQRRRTRSSGSRSTTRSSPAAGTRSSATRRSTATASRARSSTPTPTRSRAARACRSAPASACPATSIPMLGMAGAQGAQPLARRALLAQPRAALRRRARADHRPDRRRARRDPPGEGARPRRGDDPGDVGATRRRTTTVATTRCGRCARSSQMPVVTHSGSAPREEYGDHLGIYVTEVTWWPARPMWFLLWSGVFERFPGLRFGVTEGGCWWLPRCCGRGTGCASGQKGTEKLGTDTFAGRRRCCRASTSTATASPASPTSSGASSACATRSASTTCCGAPTSRTPRAPGRTRTSG